MSEAAPTIRDRHAVASDWFARGRSGRMSAEQARALKVWLAEDAANREALESVDSMWAAVEGIRADPTVLAIREEARRQSMRVRRTFAPMAVAASLVLVAATAVALRFGPELLAGILSPPTVAEYRTAVGQTSTVALPDGSRVTLDTDSVVRTSLGRHERQVELARGQAYFRVAKDHARPFLVTAAGKTVTAVGTAFDVRLDPGQVQVTLVEGRVRVEAPLAGGGDGFSRYVQSAEMTAGSRLVAKDGRPWSLDRIDTARETSWMSGQLVFAGRPLGDVATELNRYSPRKLVVADAALARTPISGSFQAGDVDGFVKAVKGYGLVRVRADTAVRIELGVP